MMVSYSVTFIICKRLVLNTINIDMTNINEYPVYPEDDGYDRFRNPYSPV
jgi:hypothetical protein